MDYITTGDGSNTIFNAQIGEHYHSKHGALQEAQHVFLKSGLQFYLDTAVDRKVSVLEVGFGTGLNFVLTADYCTTQKVELSYVGIEAFPLPLSVIKGIGYANYVTPELWDAFTIAYDTALVQKTAINPIVNLQIAYQLLLDFQTDELFDVLYFDAFAAIHQPEMWSEEALAHITKFLKPNGVFVTYAITGNLKRTMKGLGFTIEKAPGAPGKREMLRAVKR